MLSPLAPPPRRPVADTTMTFAPCVAHCASQPAPHLKCTGAPRARRVSGRPWPQRSTLCRARCVAAASSGDKTHTLVLYTKPDCPLCESLEEKLRAALEAATFVGGVLARCTLETRVDLQSQDTPFLRVVPGGTTQEVELPRPSPRVTPSKLGQQLEGWLQAACGGVDAPAMPWDAVQGRPWPPQG